MDINWDKIADQVHGVVNRLAPYAQPIVTGVEAVVPEIAPAIALGTKIIQGVIAGEEAAVELYNSITTGTPPTKEQLQEFFGNYEDAYKELDADIAEALKTAK